MPVTRLPPSGLLGRRSECESLDRLVARVLEGQSQVLVLRGHAGMGKTALLDYLAANAPECRIARAAGVESEMELPFAGVHGLCAPMLGSLRHLPDPQRDALGTAFGLAAGNPPDRFHVGLAVLSLLADVAEERPLICIVDDAQWLDQVSSQILSFVARRLLAERVGLVIAVREPMDGVELAGLPELQVGGLDGAVADALLRATVPGPLDERVRERILAEADGNPLALLELPRGPTPAAMAGGFGLPRSAPLTSRIEHGFVQRLESLPSRTRRLLLLAAAEPVGDVTLLWRAAERLGIGGEDALPALAGGLLEIGARVRFRHPLVRSAAYGAASPRDLREIHEALAAATDRQLDPDRRAWHLAHAAEGPDESVAAELERSADRARARGGIAAAAAFLGRAAELTPEPARRGERALAAAQEKLEAAAPGDAVELLAVARMCPMDAPQQARLARLQAEIVFSRNRGSDAPPLLLDAARQLEAHDPGLAHDTYLNALGAAMYAGRRYAGSGARDAAEAALQAAGAPQPPRPGDLLLAGLATRFTEGPRASAAPLRRAVQAFREEALDGAAEILRWIRQSPVVQETAVHELWDDGAWHEIASRAQRLAREIGALTMLPVTLPYLAGAELFAGRLTAAAALNEEADGLTAASGNPPLPYASLVLAAWRGVEVQALEMVDAARADAEARGEGRVHAMAGYATAVLYNGLGRYDAALESAQASSEQEDLGWVGWSLSELLEAAVRSNRAEVAASALQRLEERTSTAGTDWALGVLARAQAQLSEGEAADALYREAIDRLDRTRVRVELARSHLLYGEWLRRENRRVDAREQLRVAHEMLAGFGADGFAERARRELLATGERVRRLTTETRDALTPQETRIARLAAEGRTNPEIGAQLFISPRTVEYHLHKVFTKLGVSSRKDLRGVLGDAVPG